jgi:hypothetical protein
LQGFGELLDGAVEGLLEGCASEFRQGALGEDEGEEFGLIDVRGGEIFDIGGEVVTVVVGIVFYGDFEGVAEVFDVTQDGAAFDFEFTGKPGAVGVVAFFQMADDGAQAAQGWSCALVSHFPSSFFYYYYYY